jgi:hypothetical protein
VEGRAVEVSSRRAAAREEVKVLYIAGWGRSGSTILGRILGQIEGFFSVGELRYVWDRGVVENRLCSCGAPFMDCPVWREIMGQVLDPNGGLDAEALIDLRERGLRTRHVLFTPTHGGLHTRVARMTGYVETLEKLYRAVQGVSQSRVIVDTSKFPSYAYILRNVPGIKVYLVHLVRDPRAVAYSWASRRKPELDTGKTTDDLMASHSLVGSSLTWNEWNLAIEKVWRREPERYMQLRYEDFVRSPRTAIRDILRFIGEGGLEIPFSDEHQVSLEASHTFSGNPNRFRSGTVRIESDEEWKQELSNAHRATVTALTLPGLVRYGYRLWP